MAHTRVPGSAQRLGLGERVLDGEEVLLEAHPLPVHTLASSQDQNLALAVRQSRPENGRGFPAEVMKYLKLFTLCSEGVLKGVVNCRRNFE